MKKMSFLLSVLLLVACNDNDIIEKSEDANSLDYADLNVELSAYANSLKNSFDSEESTMELFNKFTIVKSTSQNLSKNIKNAKIDDNPDASVNVAEIYIEFPPHYTEFSNTITLDFYNDMVNAYDYEVINVINAYQNRLDNEMFLISIDEKEQFQIILNASYYALDVLEALYAESSSKFSKNSFSAKGGGFGDCFKKTVGKSVGRGIAGGAISGAISGGTGGGLLGSFFGPAGTAAGSVRGAVMGAAYGAITGAVGGVLWAAADCLAQVKRDFITLDEYGVIRELGIDPDLQIELILTP
ncbi:glycine zipper family protein [Mariniflexile gromovii]|uniref:Glycine zipper family protein n=1 Tax=Mariniflexile gromovii TaxID=362523 RepID=A0ABS4BPR9_9FLAO|nr:glycine zipper family protein [Mariniflexile gromovii]MBP0902585.1 glycine zipper family protein [Mariniflexile gromovii]